MSGWTQVCHPIGVGGELFYRGFCERLLPRKLCLLTAPIVHELTEVAACQLPSILLGSRFSASDNHEHESWFPFVFGVIGSVATGFLPTDRALSSLGINPEGVGVFANFPGISKFIPDNAFTANFILGLGGNFFGHHLGEVVEDYLYHNKTSNDSGEDLPEIGGVCPMLQGYEMG